MKVNTVGELKTLLAHLSDDTLVLTRSNPFWRPNVEVDIGSMIVLGDSDVELSITEENDPAFKRWRGKKSRPFTAVLFD